MASPIFYLLLIFTAKFISARLISQTWVIELGFVSADGFKAKAVPLVNGKFPGPTLRGTVGDSVKIRMVNKLPTSAVSIHWHGLKMTKASWSDGVPGVTQYATPPGQEYLYEFTLDLPGTVWWHSHFGLQKTSLHGFIIVDGDQHRIARYHPVEKQLLLSDWYHKGEPELVAGLFQRLPNQFGWVGDAQSITINGKAQFNCTGFRADECKPGPMEYIDVDEGQTYRVRVLGASSLSNLNLGIDGHKLTVVEAETTLIQPFSVKYLDVGAGNSYSVLLKAYTRHELDRMYPGNNGLFWIQANVRHRSKGARGTAILRYSFAHHLKTPSRKIPDDWPEREDVDWSLRQARMFRSLVPQLVPNATRRIVLLGTQNRHEDGSLVWSMNNISHVSQHVPLMHAAKAGRSALTSQWVDQPNIPVPFDYNQTLSQAGLSTMAKRGTHVLRFQLGEVVDIILQNTRALGGAEEIHPWHLHLHNFWILGYGNHHTTWKHSDSMSYDTQTPVARNMAILYPQSWTALRFVADNAGIAFFHCHIAAHLEMGMGLAFQIGTPDQFPPPPVDLDSACGVRRKQQSPARL